MPGRCSRIDGEDEDGDRYSSGHMASLFPPMLPAQLISPADCDVQ